MEKIGQLLIFKSTAFPADLADTELVNSDEMHGHALATYIGDRLGEHGITVKRYVAEDWGWYCEVENPDFSLWYGVTGIGEDEFLIQFQPDRPVIRRWCRRIDVADRVTALQQAVLEILSECQDRLCPPTWEAR